MASSAFAYRNGAKVWDVTHEADSGARHLVERGELPPNFHAVKERLMREQDLGDAEEHGVDYVWDIPVTVAYEVVGYRHDSMELKGGGQPEFYELLASDPV
jgi:hypothetical protein